MRDQARSANSRRPEHAARPGIGEPTGKHAWRVRYPASDGHTASISGFTSQKAADDHATDIETDQRRQVWIDPTLGHVTVEDWAARWLPTLDIDP